MRNFIKFEIGGGNDTHIWLDWWHSAGLPYEKYDFRVIYDAHSQLDARLSTVLRRGAWLWNPARSDELVEIQGKLSDLTIGDSDN